MNTRRLVSPLLMWIIIFIGILVSLLVLKGERLFNLPIVGLIIFGLAFVYWICIFISAWKAHIQAVRSSESITKLVTTGIYKQIRHPMYSADIVLAWGLWFYLPSINILVSMLWLTTVLIIWSRLEEKMMTEKFGNQYLKYKQNVPAFLPKLK